MRQALLITVSIACIVLLSAQVPIICGDPEKVFTLLRSKYGELPVWGGRASNSSVILTISDVGKWSLLRFLSPNRVCVIASGEGGYFYAGKPPTIYSPDTAPS